MIESLKIGPVTYAVKLKSDLRYVDDGSKKCALHGHILWMPAEIRIEDNQAAEVKIVTLWHEVLHGILNNAGQNDQPEAIIQALGFGIVQLLRENPQLVELTLNKEIGS